MSDEAFNAALAAELGETADDEVNKNGGVDNTPDKVDTNPDATKKADKDADPDQSFELDEAEIEARAKGWDPDKEGYEKRTGRRWTSAETFLAKRELSDEVSKRGKEIKTLNKRLEQMQKQMDARVEAEVKARVDALKKERADAIREQDFEEIDRLDEEIEKAKTPAAVESQDDDDPDDKPVPGSGYIENPAHVMRYVEKWKRDDAPWFDKSNDRIKTEALRIEQVYMATYPNSSIEDSLAYVKETMLKRFPELGAIGRKPQTGGAPRGGSGGNAIDESSLSADDKRIIALMEKQGAFKDAKEKASFIRETFGV